MMNLKKHKNYTENKKKYVKQQYVKDKIWNNFFNEYSFYF